MNLKIAIFLKLVWPNTSFTVLSNLAGNGPFLTVNQSTCMFTEIDVANQWHCGAHNNLCPTLHKRICALCMRSSLYWADDPGM